MPKPKVLMLEDNKLFQDILKIALGNRFELIQAFTLKEAGALFAEHKENLSAVCIDGMIESGEFNTGPFVGLAAKEFRGPIIAISGEPDVNKEMLRLGCTHAIEGGLKIKLVKILSELFPDTA